MANSAESGLFLMPEAAEKGDREPSPVSENRPLSLNLVFFSGGGLWYNRRNWDNSIKADHDQTRKAG